MILLLQYNASWWVVFRGACNLTPNGTGHNLSPKGGGGRSLDDFVIVIQCI